MRAYGLVVVAFLVCAGCDRKARTGESSQERQAPKDATVHVLTWKDFDGLTGSPDRARYVFDGSDIGVGNVGIDALRALELSAGSKVRIEYPWTYGPSSPGYMPPDAIEGLIAHWKERGVVVDDVSGFRMSPDAK